MGLFSVEHAKSGRSACKTCKSVIEKGSLRIGQSVEMGDYTSVKWHHLSCFKKPKKNPIGPEELDGFSGLAAADKKAVKEHFESGNASAPTTPVKSKKRKGDEDDDDEKPKTDSKKKKKAAQDDEDEEEAAPAKGKGKGKKKENGDAKKAPAAKKGKKVSPEEKRAKEEEEKIKAAKNEVASFSVAELKAMLKLNDQLMTGTKDELINRVADGIVYGALPRCPKCHGGRLRVKYPSKYGHGGQGSFSCPGYHDDEHFRNCSWKGDSADRVTWKLQADE